MQGARSVSWLSALVLVLVGASLVWAQDEAPTTQPAEQKDKADLKGPKVKDEGELDARRKKRFSGEGRHAGPHGKHGPMVHRLLGDLDLTDEQKGQIKTIHQQAMEARKAWREEHKEQVDAIRARMKAGMENKDHAAVQTAREEMRALWETAPNPKDSFEKVKNVLTEEQRTKLEQKLTEMREQMEKRREEMKEKREKGKAEGEQRRPPRGEKQGEDGERKPRRENSDKGQRRGDRGNEPAPEGEKLEL